MLRNIQALIERETGAPLADVGRMRLELLLNDAVKNTVGLGGEDKFAAREVTVLLTDLRGFTAISESHPAPVLLEMLNRYLVKMSEIAIHHGGTIDKFMGDAIMVLFGAPFSHVEDVKRAVTCAVDMQLALFEINALHRTIGMPELNMGIGINTGDVMAGMLGSDLYAEYTVIGDEVNLASRIEAYSLRGQVLISEATYARVRGYVTVSEPMDVYVKGKKDVVNLYEVLAIPSLGKEVPRQEIRKSPRVETNIPFAYYTLDGKIVSAEKRSGVILDISYNGVLALLEGDVPAQTDIKLDLNLPLAGTSATDVYARVLKTFERDGQQLSSIEFTSVSVQSNVNIRHFVQLLIQGGVTK
ncbi:MAG: adenylate/guanylate cyclase domain-containing protein [Burkholderiales bacterium]